MDAPKIFLSYARADHKIAERLRTGLEKHGCVVHDPAANGRLVGPRISVPYDDLKDAARRADQFVLLFGKHRHRDRMQEQEWQAALEASWDDADKKMIPVLIGNAELPNFVRGAAGTGRSTMGLHVNGLRDAERAAEMIARAAGRESLPKHPVRKRIRAGNEPGGPKTGRSPRLDAKTETYAPKRGYSLGGEDDGYEEPIYDVGQDDGVDMDSPFEPQPYDNYSRNVEEDDDCGLSFAVEPPAREEIESRFAEIRRYAKELEP